MVRVGCVATPTKLRQRARTLRGAGFFASAMLRTEKRSCDARRGGGGLVLVFYNIGDASPHPRNYVAKGRYEATFDRAARGLLCPVTGLTRQ